ncbi:hypothetical protein ACTFIY_007881 [Dictyostelium cf. discoideum]
MSQIQQQKQQTNDEDDDILSNVFSNTSFIVDPDSNFKKEENTRLKQYKSINSNQHEKRIQYFLDRQKEKRRSLLSHVRQLITLPTNDTSIEINTNTNTNTNNNNDDDVSMNEDENIYDSNNNNNNKNNNNINNNKKDKFKEINKKKQQNKSTKQDLLYSNHLMLAEGMVHIPITLEREWYCVPVPLGYRCLVISQNDWTIVRSAENGQVLKRFKSLLPFGSEESRESCPPQNQHCILDCIFQDTENTFYILDILSWKGYILYDCDTEFRFFWRDSKLLESKLHQQTKQKEKENQIEKEKENENENQEEKEFTFLSIPYFSSNVDSLEQIKFDYLLKRNNANTDKQILQYKTEFLLFYHKSSHYEFGTTPLFCSLAIEYIDTVIEVLNYRNEYGTEEEEGEEQEQEEDEKYQQEKEQIENNYSFNSSDNDYEMNK